MVDEGLCALEVVDVDRDMALLARYGMDLPVLILNGSEWSRHRVDGERLRAALLGAS